MKQTQTKQQQRREARYRQALRQCGFRSWLQANRRRGYLIAKSVDRLSTAAEDAELNRLQRLADFYDTWKTNDDSGRLIRCLKRRAAKYAAEDTEARRGRSEL